MTDNEIIKALECCVGSDYGKKCWQCPIREVVPCTNKMSQHALDLINRLQAENERLCAEIDELIIAKDLLFDEAETLIKKGKTEAYKQCIEKVKERSNKTELVCSGALVRTDYTITEEKLDNLLKELESETNDNRYTIRNRHRSSC